MQAYGGTYEHRDDVYRRISEINEMNYRYGASDGRVAELDALFGLLILMGYEKTPAQEYIDRCKNFEQEFKRAFKRDIRATDFQFGYGSRVVSVKTIRGAQIPVRGKIEGIHPLMVSVKYDEPIMVPGRWAGDPEEEHRGGAFFPYELRHED